MSWRLGLDLGTNSIGWCALKLADKKVTSLLDMGVRIFSDGRDPKGESLAVERRNARALRRRNDRLIKRKRQLVNVLIENELMPYDPVNRKSLEVLNPYELRSKALDCKLTKNELGRALFHLGVRRGFKSNRKDLTTNDKELTINKEKISNLTEALKDSNARTLGEYLWERQKRGESIRFRPDDSSFYPDREMYSNEFHQIKSSQSSFGHKINWDEIENCIFYQRPLRKKEKGKCQFYTKEPRASKAIPSAQRFRILQEINNLSFTNAEGSTITLSYQEKDDLFNKLDNCKQMSFNSIRKFLNLQDEDKFNLEDSKRDKLLGNATSFEMRKEGNFGKQWNIITPEEQDKIVEVISDAENDIEIYTIIEPYPLSDEQKRNIVKSYFATQTSRLSSRFMRECNDIMLNEHLPYHEAVVKLGLHHSYSKQGELLESLPYYGEILSSYTMDAHPEIKTDNPEIIFGRIGNPTVHIALNQLRKLLNRLIDRFGAPDQIIVEVAREIKLSKQKKYEIFKEQSNNQKQNQKIKEWVNQSFGIVNPSSWDIKKYKLWEELGYDSISRKCVYCGKTIPANKLYTSEIEIEHILPFSQTLLDSMRNLTVSHRTCNQSKGNRSPYDAFGHNPNGFNYQAILDRAKALPGNKYKLFAQDALKTYTEESSFITRQINDNAYIAQLAKQYLSGICNQHSIWTIPGRQTSILRAKWGLNTILNSNHDTWFKNRSDHRHHAIDALVIGLTDRSLIQSIALLNKYTSPMNIILPPLPIPRTTVEEKLTDIIVSHKPDHGYQGRIFKETAVGKHKRIERIPFADIKESEVRNLASSIYS
jgi:CRISPR-associated endonuclease Csn1